MIKKSTLPQLRKTNIMMQKPMLEVSYRAAYLIAKSKRTHSIRVDLIKPCLVEVAEIIFGNEAATKLNGISVSDNTLKRRIEDKSILAQIVQG